MTTQRRTDREEILERIELLTRAYETRDARAFLDAFARTEAVMAYGTGIDEKRLGPEAVREQIVRDWAQSEAAAMRVGWTQVTVQGDVAWVAADLELAFTVAGERGGAPGRATFVLVREVEGWKIEHFHCSAPALAQAPGSSF